MALTMTPERFLEIKAEMERRNLVVKAANIVAATAWDTQQPAFSDVDAFLVFLDNKATDDRPARSSKRR